ncbi:hypothetical protein MSG28_013905 [Choristoneura fumiferana]|uniref:Uncharacterized protein n=1 Tax=Choristoneura fumiferana TaxID=7141 RepID=A0ACC0K9V6_CHOFU|nr:hypothetical protein MSG28_013905 [Choristoneura fumiferana]
MEEWVGDLFVDRFCGFLLLIQLGWDEECFPDGWTLQCWREYPWGHNRSLPQPATADLLAERLKVVIGDQAEVTRPTKLVDLKVTGLDETVGREELAIALAKLGGCASDKIKIGGIRSSAWGQGSALVRCPAVAAKAIATAGKVPVGWVVAAVKPVEALPMRCYKCMALGHTRALCPSEAEHGLKCFRCGIEGHLAATCEAVTKCAVMARAYRTVGWAAAGALAGSPPWEIEAAVLADAYKAKVERRERGESLAPEELARAREVQREEVLERWADELVEAEYGLRTIEAIHPVLQDWCRREHGSLTFRLVQELYFKTEFNQLKQNKNIDPTSRLRTLTPVLGNDGLLRVGGRIDATREVSLTVKRPIILDGHDHITRLIVKHFHERAAHAFNEMVVNELRQRYWIIKLRPTVRAVASRCLHCKLRRVKPQPPRMGDLPEGRLSHHQRPFTHCGVDLFGPMDVTVGRRREKRYGVLFTCLTVRAVHIETVTSLSTDSLIMALRRMAARRGWPAKIYSDNGTNLKGAEIELKKSFDSLNQEYLCEYATNYGVEWHFISPASPHMAGAWERMIRCVKTALKAVLKERAPRDETLMTLLMEVEAMVNSRPLAHVSVDHDAHETLTPNHFLIGSSSGLPIPGEFNEGDLYLRRQWRIAQRLADLFWSRWMKEILPTLLPRSKWTEDSEDLRQGDLVVIVDPNSSRNCWARGRIVQTHPGQDGRVGLGSTDLLSCLSGRRGELRRGDPVEGIRGRGASPGGDRGMPALRWVGARSSSREPNTGAGELGIWVTIGRALIRDCLCWVLLSDAKAPGVGFWLGLPWGRARRIITQLGGVGLKGEEQLRLSLRRMAFLAEGPVEKPTPLLLRSPSR